jgi:competence protein ComGC
MMEFEIKKFNLTRLQWIVWIAVWLSMMLNLLQYKHWTHAVTFSLINCLIYCFIVYVHALWIIPRFYDKKRYAKYALMALLLIVVANALDVIISISVYNTWLATELVTINYKMVVSNAFSTLLVFIVSISFSLALRFFHLSRNQERIKAERANAELSLLKQQLHPHFLFNTLNNIYYLAQRDSPETADLINRLSKILRYFLENSPKASIKLQDEIELIKDYIELERIRIHNSISLMFEVLGSISRYSIPPFLLMPIIENIFKHGVGRKNMQNRVEILVDVIEGNLHFSAKNDKQQEMRINDLAGIGIVNLKKRLELYYGHNFTLLITESTNSYELQLTLPLYEN